MTHLLCCGLGYSARPIARALAAEGWSITATSRDAGRLARIVQAGYTAEPYAGNGIAALRHRQSPLLESLTHLLVSAPPGGDGDPLLADHTADLALAPNLRWIGYLSTVGVYGDHDGAWVDETTAPRPLSQRSRRRLAAEQDWTGFGHRTGRRVAIFRLSGIYGPGRSALDQLRAGTARRIVKPGQVFNRIHVDDIGATVCAAIAQRADGVFNVTDDEPAPPQDVITYAAELMGVAPPPATDFAAAELSPMARSFYAESKRVANARIKTNLGIRLAYPTFRDGLAAIHALTASSSD